MAITASRLVPSWALTAQPRFAMLTARMTPATWR